MKCRGAFGKWTHQEQVRSISWATTEHQTHILTRTKSPFCSLDPTSTSNDTNNWGRAPFHHYKGWLSPGTPRSLGKSPLVLTLHISYTTTSLTNNRVFSRVKELANRQQIPYHHKGENQTTAKKSPPWHARDALRVVIVESSCTVVEWAPTRGFTERPV